MQWGGRFAAPPDPALIAFGSSLEDDLVLAPFDVQTSRAHVDALAGGEVITASCAHALREALDVIAAEIESGALADFARASGAEDVHGAIDARVRDLAADAGAWLHSGRSRNDQVATTLALYAHARAQDGVDRAHAIAAALVERAEEELHAETVIAAVTHWQPAQPVLLAFWLAAAAEPFARAARSFAHAAADAKATMPLGSAALAGSNLPLDRAAACALLGFAAPTRNALDAVGTRDAVLNVAHAYVRAVASASRICEELTIWATPAFGYVRLGDASSTGSSLMPQKRNPDIFELVRGGAHELIGLYSGALGTTVSLPLSYHRDLQQTKRLAMLAIERGVAMLDAFERALRDTTFVREAMNARAADGYTVATDLADALIASGVSARDAHAHVGEVVRTAEAERRSLTRDDLASLAERASVPPFDAPLDARQSVRAKATSGSTAPEQVRASLAQLKAELATIATP